MATKKTLLVAAAFAAAGAFILSADWPSSSGNPQRDGWSKGEKGLSRAAAAAGNIKLLYSFKADSKQQRMGTPSMLSNIIAWKGFKALLFVNGATDVYSIDSDIGKPYFKTSLGAPSAKAPAATALCPGGATASVAMSGNSANGGRGGGPPAGGRGASGGRGAAPADFGPAGGRGASGPGRQGGGGGGGGGRGGAPYVWAVAADGTLHTLRQQDGDNKVIAPMKFLPENANAADIAVGNNVVYAATRNECGGSPNALYALELALPAAGALPGDPYSKVAPNQPVSFPTNGSGFAGSASVAISTDNTTVYGLIPDGQGTVAGKYSNTVVALDAKTLAVKDYFTPSGPAPAAKKGQETPGATPAVFSWNGKDVVVSGGTDGRLYLLDAASLGGSDHHTALAQSDVFAAADGTNGIWNAFATWEDPEQNNARWVYASISGASPLKFSTANGAAPTGSIVAFKIEDRGGKPAFTAQWSSRDLTSPAAPVVTNGLVFALSTGQGKTPKNAVLYALDSSTGKEIWSSGQTVTSYATGGLAVNSSMVLFATHDSTIHAFGIPIIF